MKLDRSTATYAVILAAIVGAFVLGIYALTPVPDRAGLLRAGAAPLGGLLAAVSAAVAAKLAHQTQKETAAQTPVLDRIKHQTNGELTQRVRDAVNDALNARETEPAPAPVAEVKPAEPVPFRVGY